MDERIEFYEKIELGRYLPAVVNNALDFSMAVWGRYAPMLVNNALDFFMADRGRCLLVMGVGCIIVFHRALGLL